MTCSDIEDLLSAYANDELSRTQREFVEEHLSNCTDCQRKLAELRDVRRQLQSLSETRALYDMKGTIMSEIGRINTGRRARRWLRPVLVAVPVVAALAVLIAWQPWSSNNPQSAVARAQVAMAKLQSYRVSVMDKEGTDNQTSTTTQQMEFVAPDRYDQRSTSESGDYESIMIGDQIYYKGQYSLSVGSFVGARVAAGAFSSMLTTEATSGMLNYLKDVTKLPDETINGTVCLHYHGTFDFEKQMRAFIQQTQESNADNGTPPLSKETQEQMLKEASQAGSRTVDLWIGKDDYLIRQTKWDIQGPDSANMTQHGIVVLTFSDFNQPITIVAPLDANGQLLPGWTSASPASPNVKADIQSQVDNQNPSARKVDYTIDLSNVGGQALADVMVNFVPLPSGGNGGQGTWYSTGGGPSTPGPLSLAPGESVQYTCTFGYDATKVGPDVAAQSMENMVIQVIYSTPEGQQKQETFHLQPPESIYTLPTAMPPNLVPVQISAAGEYVIKESGATYTGQGATGEINGKQYLFVPVNTQGAETPTPPGILVLDIQDVTHPEKISYFPAPDDTWYLLFSAFHNGVLYVSTGKSLWAIDMSDPSAPRQLSTLSGLTPEQMTFSGNYAFMNDGNHDIVTLDISDPAHPQKVGDLPLSSSTGISLHVQGNYILAWVTDTLDVIDASSPASLKTVNGISFDSRGQALEASSATTTSEYHISGITYQDNYAYVALDSDNSSGMAVLDVSKPESPHEIAFLNLEDERTSGPLFVSGNRAYMLATLESGPDHRTRLDIIDISNPHAPLQAGYGIMPNAWSFFKDFQGGSYNGYDLVNGTLYWYIGNPPNAPVIEVFNLPGQ